MASRGAHSWVFGRPFRARGFGWRSQPAIARVREAVAEIAKVSPALERVDSSSGAMGTAVNHAVETLAALIARAPADDVTRDRWLERLWQAYTDDAMPYIEQLGDHWGALCATPARASRWADLLLPALRTSWADRRPGGYFPGTPLCLSSLLAAGRHEELLAAHDMATRAAQALGCEEDTRARIRALVEGDQSSGAFVRQVLHRQVGLAR